MHTAALNPVKQCHAPGCPKLVCKECVVEVVDDLALPARKQIADRATAGSSRADVGRSARPWWPQGVPDLQCYVCYVCMYMLHACLLHTVGVLRLHRRIEHNKLQLEGLPLGSGYPHRVRALTASQQVQVPGCQDHNLLNKIGTA